MIVGAGITGVVTAIELARAGCDVVVIEASHVGSGATGGSLGVLSTPAAGVGFGDPDELVYGRPRKLWHRDRLAAQRYLLRLIEESGTDCDLRKGAVALAPTARNAEQLAATVEARNAWYESSDVMLSADQLEQEAGGRVAELFAGGLVMSDAHFVQPARMITGLATLARSLGVVICERTEVVGVQARKGGFRVLTNGGDITAENVFLATGGYTTDAVSYLRERTLGVPSIAIASEEIPEDEVRDICRSGRVLMVNRFRTYTCRPTGDGRRIVLGGPVSQVPGTPRQNVQRLHDYFLRLFPDLTGVEFTHSWVGMVAATRDRTAHSGMHDGIRYAVGGSGLVSCADAGRRMARSILHDDEADEPRFPRWPMRDSEHVWWRVAALADSLQDLRGKSRLR